MLKSIYVLLALCFLLDCILIIYCKNQRQKIYEIEVNFKYAEETLKDLDSIRSKRLIETDDSLMLWLNSESEDISRLAAKQFGLAQEYMQYRNLMLEDASWRGLTATESYEMINWFIGLAIAHLTCTFVAGLLLWTFNNKVQFVKRM